MVFIYLYIDLKYGKHSWIWSSPFPRDTVNREKRILKAPHIVELPANRIVMLCTPEEQKALVKYQ